jgi:hypothetical protein
MGGGSVNVPGPSAEERRLQAEQAEMIRENRDIARAMYQQQKLLAPFMYKQLNLKPITNDAGDIVGFEELDPSVADPNYYIKRQIEKGFLDRTLAALRGELPVDPALVTDLNRQEEALREVLRKELGPGYELSTPGARRLEEFNLRKNQLLEGARRGDLTLAEQLQQAREMSDMNIQAARFGLMAQPYMNAAQLANQNQTLAGTFVNQGLQQGLAERQMALQASIANAQRKAQMFGAIAQGVGSLGGLALGGWLSGIGQAGGWSKYFAKPNGMPEV